MLSFRYALRGSKTDKARKGVEVVLAKTGSPSCPVSALRLLMTIDPQPFFRLSSGAFTRTAFIHNIQTKLQGMGVKDAKRYTGHSIRRGAAQHAADNGMLHEDIQLLGRWSSDAFKGYFAASVNKKYHANRRFLTGRNLPVIPLSIEDWP